MTPERVRNYRPTGPNPRRVNSIRCDALSGPVLGSPAGLIRELLYRRSMPSRESDREAALWSSHSALVASGRDVTAVLD